MTDEGQSETLVTCLPKGARLLGIDLGTKTIGLALSDVERRIATPFETIRRTKFTRDAESLRRIVETHGVGGFVIGMPFNMDGSEGPRVQATRSFMKLIGPLLGLPIVPWDERLSTAAVTRSLIEADTSRRRRAEVVDRAAAAYILQGYIDWSRRHGEDR
jgi:putative Holliday junction resolvase